MGISITLLFFYSLAFPIWMIVFLRRNRNYIAPGQVFTAKFNTLFLRVDYRNDLGLLLLAFSLIRRLLFAFVAVQISFNVI
jgi:hypothetical protein